MNDHNGYPSGSTGLVQQKLKKYPKRKKPTEYKLPFLKDLIKGKHDIDVVLMAGGGGFNAVEEDAILMNKICGHRIYENNAPYEQTKFPYANKLRVIEKLEFAKVSYVILSVVDHDKVIREIVNSSDPKLVGLKY